MNVLFYALDRSLGLSLSVILTLFLSSLLATFCDSPFYLPARFCRTIVSNRLSTSGNAWVENFSRYSSGTYSNQWMVLDFNKYVPFTL